MDLIRSVVKLTLRLFVLASLGTMEIHQRADQSVLQVLNVHLKKRVLILNVLIHVQEYAAKTPFVELVITVLSVIVVIATQAIPLFIASAFLVRFQHKLF